MRMGSGGLKLLGMSVALIQIFDAIVHIATNQIEPIRIASNVIMIAWVAGLWAGWLKGQSRRISLGAIGIYLLFNLIFLAQHGLTNPNQGDALRTALFLFVGLTVLISLWVTAQVDDR